MEQSTAAEQRLVNVERQLRRMEVNIEDLADSLRRLMAGVVDLQQSRANAPAAAQAVSMQ